mmetsp:Transcript_60274/g.111782  ORF Transcript_60274/g.111782 Transcript_60274/m.111782 type:complete len:391 (-) Transcript_60274:60-1232(-)
MWQPLLHQADKGDGDLDVSKDVRSQQRCMNAPAHIQVPSPTSIEARVLAAFQKWDINGTGSIPCSVLEELLCALQSLQQFAETDLEAVSELAGFLKGMADPSTDTLPYAELIKWVFTDELTLPVKHGGLDGVSCDPGDVSTCDPASTGGTHTSLGVQLDPALHTPERAVVPLSQLPQPCKTGNSKVVDSDDEITPRASSGNASPAHMEKDKYADEGSGRSSTAAESWSGSLSQGDDLARYREAHAAYEAMGGTKSAGYAELLTKMGMCHGASGHHAEAMAFYWEAKAVYEAAGTKHTLQYCELLRSMAARLRTRGRHEDAMALYREAQQAQLLIEAAGEFPQQQEDEPLEVFPAADGHIASAQDISKGLFHGMLHQAAPRPADAVSGKPC